MKPAEQLALWADKLRDVSAMGLTFVKSVYDETAYRTVQSIALEMLALASGESLETIEPLRTTIFSNPTPLSCGDAAIIDDAGRLLLVQRADNGMWATPGGAFEVGETPAQGAVREAFEETGFAVSPSRWQAYLIHGYAGSRFALTCTPSFFCAGRSPIRSNALHMPMRSGRSAGSLSAICRKRLTPDIARGFPKRSACGTAINARFSITSLFLCDCVRR